jgi:hypothetical protein
MSSSIQGEFDPPEWATREEVIKAARHYVNYWKIEARHRNAQWLSETARASLLSGENACLRSAGDAMQRRLADLDQKKIPGVDSSEVCRFLWDVAKTARA